MVKSWEKFISKNKLKWELQKVIEDISNNNLSDYSIKKLNWYEDYYRIRKWKIRIVFTKNDEWNKIIAVDTRWNIYKWI